MARLRWSLAVGAPLLLSGCPSPNLYTTARTVEQGKFSFSVAGEGIIRGIDRSEPDPYPRENAVVPAMPALQGRYGVAEHVEVALMSTPGLTAGFGMKLNFVTSRRFDLAFAPGYQWYAGTMINKVFAKEQRDFPAAHQLMLPAIIDINLHRRGTLVLTPGVHLATAENHGEGGVAKSFWARGILPRLGLGFNLRVLPFLSFQPEVTVLLPLDDRNSPTRLYAYAGVAAIAVNFPDFSDVSGP